MRVYALYAIDTYDEYKRTLLGLFSTRIVADDQENRFRHILNLPITKGIVPEVVEVEVDNTDKINDYIAAL